MSLKKVSLLNIIIVLIFSLAGCQQNFTWIKFNDVIIKHQYTKDWGLATGLHGFYVVYNKMKFPDGGVAKEGECYLISPPLIGNFRIKDLIDKYPELSDERVLKAI